MPDTTLQTVLHLLRSSKVKGLLAALAALGSKANNEDQVTDAVDELCSLEPIEVAVIIECAPRIPGVKHLPYLCARHSEDFMFEVTYYLEAFEAMQDDNKSSRFLKPEELQEYVKRLKDWLWS
jgi:hypothetical protein